MSKRKKNRQRRRKGQQHRGQTVSVYRYTCCFAGYHHPDDPDGNPIWFTAAVVDLNTDEMVESREFDADDDLEAIIEEVGALADKYDAVICPLSETLPLQPCPCCDGYMVRTVTSSDLKAAAAAMA